MSIEHDGDDKPIVGAWERATLPAAPAPTEQAALEQALYALRNATTLYSCGFNVRDCESLRGGKDNTGTTAAEYESAAEDIRGAISKAIGGIRAALAARQAPTEAPKESTPTPTCWIDPIELLELAKTKVGIVSAIEGDAQRIPLFRQAPDSRDAALVPAHLREFVEAVANRFEAIDRETDDEFCKYCSGLIVRDEGSHHSRTLHRVECIVLRAEAILPQEKAQ